MEDKEKICELLLPVIRATVSGKKVKRLDYLNLMGGSEAVVIVYQSGAFRRVSVDGMNGLQLVREILKCI